MTDCNAAANCCYAPSRIEILYDNFKIKKRNIGDNQPAYRLIPTTEEVKIFQIEVSGVKRSDIKITVDPDGGIWSVRGKRFDKVELVHRDQINENGKNIEADDAEKKAARKKKEGDGNEKKEDIEKRKRSVVTGDGNGVKADNSDKNIDGIEMKGTNEERMPKVVNDDGNDPQIDDGKKNTERNEKREHTGNKKRLVVYKWQGRVHARVDLSDIEEKYCGEGIFQVSVKQRKEAGPLQSGIDDSYLRTNRVVFCRISCDYQALSVLCFTSSIFADSLCMFCKQYY